MKRVVVTPSGSEEIDLTAPEIAQISADADFAATYSQAQAWKSYQNSSFSLLKASDDSVFQALEAGTTIPSNLITYRNSLRAIINASSGNPALPLPTLSS